MKDDELIAYAQSFRDGILDGRPSQGMCAMVCWPLEGMLNCDGVNVVTRENENLRYRGFNIANHVWIEMPDGRVLDPTADQFSTPKAPLPPVYLGKPIPGLHVT